MEDGWVDLPENHSDNEWVDVPTPEASVAPERAPASNDGWEDIPVQNNDDSLKNEVSQALAQPSTQDQGTVAQMNAENAVKAENQQYQDYNNPQKRMEMYQNMQVQRGVEGLTPEDNQRIAMQALTPFTAPPLAALKLLQMPGNIVAGPVARMINPELMEKVRLDDEMNGSSNLVRNFHEIVPPITMGQVISKYTDPVQKSVEQSLQTALAPAVKAFTSAVDKSLPKDPGMARLLVANTVKFAAESIPDAIHIGTEAVNLSAKLGADVLSDPVMNLGLFTDVKSGIAATEKGIVYKGLGEKTAAGETGLLVFNPIFGIGQPKVLIKGQEIANFAQTQMIKGGLLGDSVRGLLYNTGNMAYDGLNHSEIMSRYGDNVDFKNALSNINDGIPLSTKQADIVNAMAEFPDRWRPFLESKGIKATPAEIEQAQEIHSQLWDITQAGKEKFVNAPKSVVNEFIPGSLTEVGEEHGNMYENKFGKRNIYVDNNGVEHDFTLSDARGFGRRLSPEAAEAYNKKQLEEVATESRSAKDQLRNKGLTVHPSATLERNKLSTDAMNQVMKDYLGIENPFERDPVAVTMYNYRQMQEASRNRTYLDGVIKLGKKDIELQDYIDGTKEDPVPRVTRDIQRLKDLGLPIPYDMERSQYLNTDNFVSLPKSVLNKARTLGYDDIALAELRFEKPVAASIIDKLSKPAPAKAWAIYDTINKQVTAGVLTNPMRYMREFTENANTAVFAHGVSPTDFMSGLFKRISGKKDRISQLIDASENIYSMDKTIKFTNGDLIEPSSWRPLGDWMETFRESSAGKFFNRNVKLDSAGKFTANMVNPLPTENSLMIKVREGANGFVNVWKEARARQLLKLGYSEEMAVNQARIEYMAFDKTSPQLTSLKRVNPFSQYMVRRLETFTEMILKNPRAINGFGPEGYLFKHLQNEDLSPDQAFALSKAIRFPGDELVMSFMGGAKSVAEQAPGLNRFLNRVYLNMMPGDAQKAMEKGYISFMNIQTPYKATKDIFKLADSNGQKYGPGVHMVMGLMGYDPMTGDKLAYQPMNDEKITSMGWDKRIQTVMEAGLPINKQIFDGVIMPSIRSALPQWEQKARDFFVDKDQKYIMESLIGTKLNAPDRVVKSLSNILSMGGVNLTRADMTYALMQMAIMNKISDDAKNVVKDIKAGQSSAKDLIKKQILERNALLSRNMNAFNAYKEMMLKNKGVVPPEVNPMLDENVEPGEPVDPTIDQSHEDIMKTIEGDVHEEEDQSSVKKSMDRAPSGQQAGGNEKFGPQTQGVVNDWNVGPGERVFGVQRDDIVSDSDKALRNSYFSKFSALGMKQDKAQEATNLMLTFQTPATMANYFVQGPVYDGKDTERKLKFLMESLGVSKDKVNEMMDRKRAELESARKDALKIQNMRPESFNHGRQT